MFEPIWMMLGASQWWRRVTGSLGAVANWVGQNPVHVVLASLLAAIALNVWQWHDRDTLTLRDAARVAQWQNAFAGEQAAFRTQSQTTASLRTALVNQNASLEGLASAGRARALAAETALAAVTARDGRLPALATSFRDAANLPMEGGGCQTPAVVMAARDVL